MKFGNGKEKLTDVSVTIKRHRDKNGGHPHVIVDNVDDKHVSVGLSTKNKKGKNSNSTNYSLSRSPLSDGKHSYMRRQGTVAPKKEYDKERQGLMTSVDYQKAKEYGNKAKQKYLANKKTTKK